MRIANRLLGVLERIIGSPLTDMTEVNQDPEAVHLIDDLLAEIGKAAIMAFVTPTSDQVLGVVSELHDPHAKLAEQP